MWGSTPIFTTADTNNFRLPAATDEQMRNQIEQDLSGAATDLPVKQTEYGRITKGGALGILCKYYLNTKQWQKCVDVAQQIISLNEYKLMTNYKDFFSITNEGNKEILWPQPSIASNGSYCNNLTAITFPLDYPLLPNQGNYAAHVYVFDSFVNSFDPSDTRKLFIYQYVNKSGVLIPGYGQDKSLFNKYLPDPNGQGYCNGLDLIELRYADILLSLAEALNELNGPSSQVTDLINQIRSRAAVSLITSTVFNKESLRDFIFKERSLELYFEGKEREDLIRQGKFISNAKARGINANDYQLLYPIPQVELDANPNLKQNPGY